MFVHLLWLIVTLVFVKVAQQVAVFGFAALPLAARLFEEALL